MRDQPRVIGELRNNLQAALAKVEQLEEQLAPRPTPNPSSGIRIEERGKNEINGNPIYRISSIQGLPLRSNWRSGDTNYFLDDGSFQVFLGVEQQEGSTNPKISKVLTIDPSNFKVRILLDDPEKGGARNDPAITYGGAVYKLKNVNGECVLESSLRSSLVKFPSRHWIRFLDQHKNIAYFGCRNPETKIDKVARVDLDTLAVQQFDLAAKEYSQGDAANLKQVFNPSATKEGLYFAQNVPYLDRPEESDILRIFFVDKELQLTEIPKPAGVFGNICHPCFAGDWVMAFGSGQFVYIHDIEFAKNKVIDLSREIGGGEYRGYQHGCLDTFGNLVFSAIKLRDSKIDQAGLWQWKCSNENLLKICDYKYPYDAGKPNWCYSARPCLNDSGSVVVWDETKENDPYPTAVWFTDIAD